MTVVVIALHVRIGFDTNISSAVHSALLVQMTEKEAQRASYVVRLLHEFIDLLQESNLKAHEFAQLDVEE